MVIRLTQKWCDSRRDGNQPRHLPTFGHQTRGANESGVTAGETAPTGGRASVKRAIY